MKQKHVWVCECVSERMCVCVCIIGLFQEHSFFFFRWQEGKKIQWKSNTCECVSVCEWVCMCIFGLFQEHFLFSLIVTRPRQQSCPRQQSWSMTCFFSFFSRESSDDLVLFFALFLFFRKFSLIRQEQKKERTYSLISSFFLLFFFFCFREYSPVDVHYNNLVPWGPKVNVSLDKISQKSVP